MREQMALAIKVVDFASLSIAQQECDINWPVNGSVIGQQIVKAFEEIGFVYLKNFGISTEELSLLRTASAKFFSLPTDVKERYARRSDGNQGYLNVGRETLEPERPADIREVYDYTTFGDTKVWPEVSVAPDFTSTLNVLYNKCKQLTHHLLRAVAIGLGMEDTQYFVNAHSHIGKPGNQTILRSLYYPQVPKNIAPNQLRCGEHSDYGSVTLLFQDDAPGLQVKCKNGTFIEASPIPGTVLVNIGDLLMRWSADRFVSTRHRVVIPNDEHLGVRQSVAYFANPDDKFIIRCLDGSDKYSPIAAGEYVQQKVVQSLEKEERNRIHNKMV